MKKLFFVLALLAAPVEAGRIGISDKFRWVPCPFIGQSYDKVSKKNVEAWFHQQYSKGLIATGMPPYDGEILFMEVSN